MRPRTAEYVDSTEELWIIKGTGVGIVVFLAGFLTYILARGLLMSPPHNTSYDTRTIIGPHVRIAFILVIVTALTAAYFFAKRNG
jgi:hypothetical protein